jgi:hypothetical protein
VRSGRVIGVFGSASVTLDPCSRPAFRLHWHLCSKLGFEMSSAHQSWTAIAHYLGAKVWHDCRIVRFVRRRNSVAQMPYPGYDRDQ